MMEKKCLVKNVVYAYLENEYSSTHSIKYMAETAIKFYTILLSDLVENSPQTPLTNQFCTKITQFYMFPQ